MIFLGGMGFRVGTGYERRKRKESTFGRLRGESLIKVLPLDVRGCLEVVTRYVSRRNNHFVLLG